MTWWDWWPPWRRASDEAAKQELLHAQQRLEESEDLKRQSQATAGRLRGHLRRDRFGELVDREVFGGNG